MDFFIIFRDYKFKQDIGNLKTTYRYFKRKSIPGEDQFSIVSMNLEILHEHVKNGK